MGQTLWKVSLSPSIPINVKSLYPAASIGYLIHKKRMRLVHVTPISKSSVSERRDKKCKILFEDIKENRLRLWVVMEEFIEE
jgi:hypothetical protein